VPYETKEKHEALFNQAVKRIRRGESSLEVEHALENESLGVDTLELRTVIEDARRYVEEFQLEAFNAAVEAFENGESVLAVEKKLRACGFSRWDSELLAGRAKAKADEPKIETPKGQGKSND